MIVSGKFHSQMGPLYVFSEVRIQACMTQGENLNLSLVCSLVKPPETLRDIEMIIHQISVDSQMSP